MTLQYDIKTVSDGICGIMWKWLVTYCPLLKLAKVSDYRSLQVFFIKTQHNIIITIYFMYNNNNHMISRSRCRKHILLLLFFCSMVYSIFWNWLKVHNFKTKQVFTETTKNGTTSLQKLFLWMTVIISSTFPAINIQQICVVIKAVFWKNTSAGIGRECLD